MLTLVKFLCDAVQCKSYFDTVRKSDYWEKKTFEDSIKSGPNLPHDNELFRSKRNLTSNNRMEKETVEV